MGPVNPCAGKAAEMILEVPRVERSVARKVRNEAASVVRTLLLPTPCLPMYSQSISLLRTRREEEKMGELKGEGGGRLRRPVDESGAE